MNHKLRCSEENFKRGWVNSALQDGTVLNCGDKDVRGERRISYLGSLRLDMEFWDADVQDEYWDGVGRPDSNIMGHCIDNVMITS